MRGVIMNISTLDIDNNDKCKILDIIQKISRCKFLRQLNIRLSPSDNGYHFNMICDTDDCDMCRMVFDDQTRFTADITNRKPYQRNVLFDFKSYRKGGKTITLPAGSWLTVYPHLSLRDSLLGTLTPFEPKGGYEGL